MVKKKPIDIKVNQFYQLIVNFFNFFSQTKDANLDLSVKKNNFYIDNFTKKLTDSV